MMKNYRYLFFLCSSLLLLSACNNTKHLADNQSLYVGSNIKIKATGKVDEKELKSELQDLLRPKPNSKLLGMRFKLTMYNLAGKSNKGLSGWIKRKIGEPPVLTSMSALEKNRAVLQNRLENRGYFHDTVMVDTSTKNKKTTAIYTAYIGEQYKLRNVKYVVDSTAELGKQILRVVTPARKSLLKKDDPYDLETIKDERVRLDERLKNRGFYYFNPDYLLANADSAVGEHKVDINMTVKRITPENAKHVYRIKDVIVYADYDIDIDTSVNQPGVKHYGGYTIIDPKNKFKPKIFSRALVFDTGAIYKRDDHNLSLNRLVTLGTFKFVKARFQPVDTSSGHWLNAYYYLTPTEKKSIRFEASALTKSNNSNGGELTLSWRHRNLLKGAELFTLSVYGGLEKQVISGSPDVNITRYGAEASITVPRIIAPFKFQTNSGFMPKTRAALGYDLYDRTDQYTLNSARASYSYIWKESLQKEHQLTAFNFNFVRPSNITDSFQRQLDTNIVLARSIEKQFIIGSVYNYNYNSQLKQNNRKNNFYFNGNLDLSGNWLGIVTGADVENGKQKNIFGIPFAQYIRTEAEFRHYYKISKTSVLASRALVGVGYTYGNSRSMPYVKAFFAGGANDLRGFSTRSLGPGSYYAGNPADSGRYLGDQPGDMKLELNTELRAKLFSVIQGALFVDAGNTWLVREDSARKGAKFTSSFIKQIAVSTGVGLRLDFSILVLRIDVGFPLRKPDGKGGFDWVIDKIDPFNPSWRKSNLVYNLAIGYPF